MKRRSGFTIVELLVSMALIIFIMVILSNAFIVGIDSFRRMKALGDMQERLRTVSVQMRQDLSSLYLAGSPATPLSQFDFTSPADVPHQRPPDEGFFRIWQGSPTLVTPTLGNEGADPDGIPSSRATDHLLHFTIQRAGNRPENYLSAAMNDPTSPFMNPIVTSTYYPTDYYQSGTYKGQLAEVAYFVKATGQSANGTPLYALYRRQLIAMPTGMNTSPMLMTATTASYNNYYEVSAKPYNPATAVPGPMYFNTISDLTVPQLRFVTDPLGTYGIDMSQTSAGIPLGGAPWSYPAISQQSAAGAAQIGDDVILSDVVSFEVKVLYDRRDLTGTLIPGTDFGDLPPATDPAWGNNSVFTALNASSGVRVFDTWCNKAWTPPGSATPYYDYSTTSATPWNVPGTDKSLPLKIRVRALQITLRVWDSKTEQTRQITVVHEM